jgi:hypothetical protein
MGIDFFTGYDAIFHQASNHRMITCDLPETFGWTIEVCATIPNIGDIRRGSNDKGSSQSRAHHTLLLLVFLVNGKISPMNALFQQIGEGFVFISLLQKHRGDNIADGLYCHPACHLPIRMTSHAIGNHEEPDRFLSIMPRAHALNGEEVIFVRRIFAYNPRVQADPNYQAQWLIFGERIRL